MRLFHKELILIISVIMVALELSGCGETFHGIGKDIKRVGKGVKTIFIRDNE